MPATAAVSAHIAAADPTAITSVASQLLSNSISGDLLSPNNPYRRHCVSRLEKCFGGPRRRVPGLRTHKKHLTEYIAASVIAHAFDGWSYFSRALAAEMSGDSEAARHLAYFAELRAAMAILARHGVGVFSSIHIVITGPSECYAVRDQGPTHKFVWNAFDELVDHPSGQGILLSAVAPEGVPLSDWLVHVHQGYKQFATTLMRRLGFDLERLAADKHARNRASYRPTTFVVQSSRSIDGIVDDVLRFWELCAPGAVGGFPILDRHILAYSLRKLDFGWRGGASPDHYARKLVPLMHSALRIPVSPALVAIWTDVVKAGSTAQGSELIRDAFGTVGVFHRNYAKQMLARTVLLLRIATGCSAVLLNAAGPGAATGLTAWSSRPEVRRRLWHPSSPPQSYGDLWPPIEDAVDATRRQFDGDQNIPQDHYELEATLARETSVLSTAERAFLWGVRP